MHVAAILRRLTLVLPLLALAPPVHADDLYSAQVPVTSQSAKDRGDALKTALSQVIVNLTGGDTAVLAQPQVAKATADAQRYVQQYEYTREVTNDNGQPVVHLQLVAQFDRNAVDQLLSDLGLTHAAGAGSGVAQAAVDVQPREFHVWVSGIRSALDFAAVVGNLNTNDLVHNVQAQRARGDGVELSLQVTGPLSRLLGSLTGTNLQVLNAKPPLEGIDALLGVQH